MGASALHQCFVLSSLNYFKFQSRVLSLCAINHLGVRGRTIADTGAVFRLWNTHLSALAIVHVPSYGVGPPFIMSVGLDREA